jgi:hypothetical protein
VSSAHSSNQSVKASKPPCPVPAYDAEVLYYFKERDFHNM